jgi:hypothetical protein
MVFDHPQAARPTLQRLWDIVATTYHHLIPTTSAGRAIPRLDKGKVIRELLRSETRFFGASWGFQ